MATPKPHDALFKSTFDPSVGPEAKEMFMTAAEEFIAEGLIKGREEGRVEG